MDNHGEEPVKIEFKADKELHGGIVVLRLRGRIDAFVYSLFRDRLIEAINEGQQKVVLDLRDTENINTTCVGLIVSKMKQCRDAGGDIKLVGLSGYVQRILQPIGVLKVFAVYESDDQAVDAFQQPVAK
ncbi:MAG TPA: STAS domain-containing protein [bacterium]|nr:STAS domain-containing protein [bacterium]